jgi:hypothetical protein
MPNPSVSPLVLRCLVLKTRGDKRGVRIVTHTQPGQCERAKSIETANPKSA